MHARQRGPQDAPAGATRAAPMPPPPAGAKVDRTAPPAPTPHIADDSADADVEALRDSLVLLALTAAGGDVAVQDAARQLARRRDIPLADALGIIRSAREHLRDVGRVRKNLDPATEHELVGQTRARFMLIFQTAMRPENFGKGGAATAVKAAEKLAILDGCPVDGMVEVVVRGKHEHVHRVLDPERERIAEAILARAGVPARVIEAEAEVVG